MCCYQFLSEAGDFVSLKWVCILFKQVFCKSSSWLIKSTSKPPSTLGLRLKVNTVRGKNPHYQHLLHQWKSLSAFLPIILLSNKYYTVDKQEKNISRSTTCALLPVSEDLPGGFQNSSLLGHWERPVQRAPPVAGRLPTKSWGTTAEDLQAGSYKLILTDHRIHNSLRS